VLPTPTALVEDELRYAAMMDRPARVRLLLRHRAELNLDLDATVDDPAGPYTAHDLAVLAGNADIAELLAAAGARVRSLRPVDQLLAACMRADGTAVQRLQTRDPGLAQRAVGTEWAVPFSRNPLHLAALFGRPEAVRLLISVGFPVNDRRLSPLHVAALAGHLDLVRLLVELGGDPTAEAVDDETPGQFTPPDRTPCGWARYNGQHHVVAYLSRLDSGVTPPRAGRDAGSDRRPR
jgi:ankyrin repeat protein